jgi:hypothetical protein
MRRILAPLAAVALLGALVPVALAADDALPHTGRVLVSTSGDFTLPAGEQADVVVVVDGTATVAGTANVLVVVNGRAILQGATLENVFLVRSPAELDATTHVLNDVRTWDSSVTRAAGARVDGSVGDVAGDVVGAAAFLVAAAFLLWIGVVIVTLLAALVLAAMAARQVRAAGALISHEPGKTALVGFVAMIGIPVLAVAAMITLVGIPVGIGLLLFVYPALAFIGYLVAAIWIGEWLVGRSSPGVVRRRPYLAAVIGVVVAGILGFVPLLSFVISLFGFGAVVLAGWRVFRSGSAPEPMVTMPQPSAPPMAG